MPVYNGEAFLREALNSLVAQTFVDFELIISDNASTDATEAICREYAARDERIRYVRQPDNKGAEANFQFVLDASLCEYFMWAGADDVWDVRWIERLMQAYRDNAALTFGRVAAMDEMGKIIRSYRNLEFSGGQTARSLRFIFQDEFEGKANLIYGLMRTDMLREILDTFPLGSELFSDVSLVYSILQRGGIVTVQDTMLYKRYGGLSVQMASQFSLYHYLTASYLLPYYIRYVRRTENQWLRALILTSIPFLFMKANFHRLKRVMMRTMRKTSR
ncbi:MAG: glycosyltransferase [Deltaproteobacteria bacterium]|nr:glycosyltransferase [Deltaproteobacteria bacterium]